MNQLQYLVKEFPVSTAIASCTFPAKGRTIWSVAVQVSKALKENENCSIDKYGRMVICTNCPLTDSQILELHKRIQPVLY